MRCFLFIFGMLFSLGLYGQTQLYVDSSITTGGSGSSWANACKTLNDALNQTGDTNNSYIIHIARGTYYPTRIKSGTSRDSTFKISRGGIWLLGGYPSGGGTRTPAVNTTILSGNISLDTNADNSYHIMTVLPVKRLEDSILLDGLQFTGGRADKVGLDPFPSLGGAIYSSSQLSSSPETRLRINNCEFTNNYSYNSGGAIYNAHILLIIVNSQFVQNETFSTGAGLYATGRSPVISQCNFLDNKAKDGAAIRMLGLSAGSVPGAISFCNFIGNNCLPFIGSYGAAIYANLLVDGAPFKVTNCNFSNNSSTHGGCITIYLNRTIGQDLISDCTFNNNTGSLVGGAVLCSLHSDTLFFRNCTFNGNSSPYGAAIYDTGSSVTHPAMLDIGNCTFTGNISSYRGGAVCNNNISNTITGSVFTGNTAVNGGVLYNKRVANAYLDRNRFAGNTASGNGGVMYNDSTGSNFRITSCLLSGNKASGRGGAVYDTLGAPQFTNCTFSGDTAWINGNGIYNTNSSPAIRNCIVWDGLDQSIVNIGTSAPSVTYCTVEGGYIGTGNLSSNPLFRAPVSSAFAPTINGNYHVSLCSPTINTGLNIGSYTGLRDLDLNDRLIGQAVDRGAYESPTNITITGPDPLCRRPALYTGTPSGGTWRSSNTSVATVSASGVVTPLINGTTTLVYKTLNTDGCYDSIVRIIMVVLPDMSLTTTGSQLKANQNGATYQWINCLQGKAPLAGQTAQTFNPQQNGEYAVIITWNGCSDTSACIKVTNLAVGESGIRAIKTYPNPSAGLFTVNTGSIAAGMIRILDMTGRTVRLVKPVGTSATIDMSDAGSGIYQVEVYIGEEKYIGRICLVE